MTALIAIPTGYLVGHQIAFLLLGEPMRLVGHQHISLIPILFTLLVGGVGFHYYATREQLAKEAAARSEAQRLAVESQLRLLRAQLEPHMLFNTLANLRSLVREDADQAESMIDQLIVYLRSALAASQTDSVTLSQEFAQLRAYLDIMAVRMGPRLAFTLDLPESLHNAAVPPLLLQPLVENAVRHGLEPQVGGGHIRVRASTLPSASGTSLVLEVVDTGVGLAPPPTDHADGTASHFGLAQVRERLATLYGPQGTLELIAARAGGTSARVTFPLNFPTT